MSLSDGQMGLTINYDIQDENPIVTITAFRAENTRNHFV
jgi:hypothetical protein